MKKKRYYRLKLWEKRLIIYFKDAYKKTFDFGKSKIPKKARMDY